MVAAATSSLSKQKKKSYTKPRIVDWRLKLAVDEVGRGKLIMAVAQCFKPIICYFN